MKIGRLSAVTACSAALAIAALPASVALAGSHAPRARQHAAAPAVQRDTPATAWPELHGDPRLTGVSSDHAISTANAGNLGLQWMTQTGAAAFTSPVTSLDTKLHKTLAFVGTTNGYFEAIDTANGSILWSDSFGVPLYSTPVIHGNDVWMGTFVSGRVYKLDASTGAVKCSVSLGTGSMMSSLTEATPPGGKPTVFYGVLDNGRVSGPIMAVNEATCKVEWKVVPYAQMSGTWASTSYGVDAKGEPLTIIGTSDADSTVYAVDAKTGKKVWSNRNLHPAHDDIGAGITISPPGKNGYKDGVAYYPGEDGLLYAIDLTTGKTLWTFNFRAATTPSQFKGGRATNVLDGNTLIVGTGTGVMAVNATTGKEIWDSAKTVSPGTEIVSSPLITGPPGGQVVVYCDMNGVVRALSLASGNQLWSFQTHGYIMSSPADTNGHILVLSSDGFLYSFGSGGTTSSTYPSTKITSPANGASVPNPNSKTSSQANLKLSGTATTQHSSPNVLVGIQQDGADGPWWNAARGTWQKGPAWNRAAVTSSGGNAHWTFKAPVGRAGAVWHVNARAQDSDGEVDPVGGIATVTIRPVGSGPRLKLSVKSADLGQAVGVSGAGFRPRETVRVSLPGAVLAKVTASSRGRIGTKVRVPVTTPYGTSAVEAKGKSSGRDATAALYVSSPWTQLGQDPGRSGFLPNDQVLQRVEVPDKIYRMKPSAVYNTGAPIASSPAVANGLAYVGNDAGVLVAVHTITGARAWQAKTGGAIKSSPALDPSKNIVVVGSEDGSVYGFNLRSGKKDWSTHIGGTIDSSPGIFKGSVYIGSSNGKLFVLNEASGKVRWTGAMKGAVASSPSIDTADGLVVVGDSAGDVTAFGITGAHTAKKAWSHKTGGAVNATPIVSGGKVYVGSNDGHEYALHAKTGTVKWSKSLGGKPSATAALNGNKLFAGSSSGTLFTLDARTGKVQWQFDTGAPVTGVSSTVGLAFCESTNGTVSGFRGGGELVWTAQIGTSLSGTPAISDNAVLIGSGNAGLYIDTPFALPMI